MAGLAVVFALAAMAMEGSIVCYMAFVLPLALAPYVIVQRRYINKLPTLRGQISLCREHASRLAQQNLRFSKENDRMEAEMNRLQAIEQQLEATVLESGGSVEELLRLLKENGKIQKQMMDIQRAEELQSVMAAMFRADRDGDFRISEEEFDELILRLKCFNIVDKDRIRETLMHSAMGQRSITSMYQDLEDEIREDLEDDTTFSTTSRSNQAHVNGANDISYGGTQCLETDSSFVYARCVD